MLTRTTTLCATFLLSTAATVAFTTSCTQPLPNPHGMIMAPAVVGHGVVSQYPVVPGVGHVYSNPAPTVAPQPRIAPQSMTRAE